MQKSTQLNYLDLELNVDKSALMKSFSRILLLFSPLIFGLNLNAQSRLELNSDILFNDTVYSENDTIWLKISLFNNSNEVATDITISALHDSVGEQIFNGTGTFALRALETLDTFLALRPNRIGISSTSGSLDITALTSNTAISPAIGSFSLTFITLKGETPNLWLSQDLTQDSFNLNQYYPFKLSLSNSGKVDYYKPEGFELFYSVNGNTPTSFYSSNQPVYRENKNKIDINDSIPITIDYFKKGGGNIVVVWPVGFAKIDSIADTIYIDWPESITKPKLNKAPFYPNPTQNFIFLNYKINDVERVRIFDLNGKEVLSTKPLLKINISELNKGIYLLQIESKTSVYQSQLVIN